MCMTRSLISVTETCMFTDDAFSLRLGRINTFNELANERPTFNELASILDRILQLVAGYIELSMILPVHANEGNTGGYEGYEEVEVTDHESGKMSLRIMHAYLQRPVL